MIAETLLALLGVYLACGLVFAVAFALIGVRRVDPHAAGSSWGFRALVVPGAMALWPLLLKRWTGGVHAPPTERNAHRCAARRDGGTTRDRE